jgi:serine/threonine-protein kinase ULK/ATG1
MKQVGEYLITHYNIAKGAFASIHKGKHIYSSLNVAIKEISTQGHGSNIKTYIKREIEIHRSLDHPNIVKVYDVIYNTNENLIYIIMEFCEYGDLQKFQNKKSFSEKYIQYYMLQLRDALLYLQTKNIVHRDLKPQNILLISTMHIKITDFGLARSISSSPIPSNLKNTLSPPTIVENLFSTYCGSPIYMSPELLNHESYTSKSDLWSLGVILYELITGIPPYLANNLKQLVNKVNTEKIDLSRVDRTLISEHCFDLLTRLLNPDKNTRVDWHYFFSHPWFDKIIMLENENKLIENPLDYDLIHQQHKCTFVEQIESCSRNNSIVSRPSSTAVGLIDSKNLEKSNSGLKFSGHLKIQDFQESTPNETKPSPPLGRRTASISKNFTFSLKSSQFQEESPKNEINLSDLIQDDITNNDYHSISKPIEIKNSSNRPNAPSRLSESSSSSNFSNTPNNNSKYGTSLPNHIHINKNKKTGNEQTGNESNTSPRSIMNALRFIKETYDYLSSDNKSL